MTINNKFNLSKIKKFFPRLKYNSKNLKKIESEISQKLSVNNLKLKKKYHFREFGKIFFPYYEMGNIKSTDLYCANEFIIFFLYHKLIDKYKYVGDFGANLGIHSIILDKCGFNVTAFEPDPKIFKKLKTNIKLNNSKNVKLINSAIYLKNTTLKFTRVKDNLMASHISNEKKSYGRRENILVKAVDIRDIVNNFDLVKMDIEGVEAKVLCCLKEKDYFKTDFIVEVGNKKNSRKIFNFLKKKKLNFYSQKNNFKLINKFDAMPFSHKEGLLFISQKNFLF